MQRTYFVAKSSLHLIMCGRLELWCDILSSCRERKFLIYCPWSQQPELSDRASTHQTYHDLNPDHPILPRYYPDTLITLIFTLIFTWYYRDLNLILAAPSSLTEHPLSKITMISTQITPILPWYHRDIIPILSWISAAQAHQPPMILTDSYVISPDIIQYPIRYYPILSSTFKPHKTYHPYQVTIWSCRPRNWCKLNSFWS